MTVVDGQWRPGKQPQRWNYEPAELFRPVSAPSLGVRPLWLSSPWHGPAGGHDQNYNYEAAVTVFFDIFDVFSWFGDVFEKLFDDHAEKFGAALQAFFLTLQLVHLLAGGLFVYFGWRGRAPPYSRSKTTLHPTLRVLLAFGLIGVAFCAPSPPAARCTFYNLGRPPEVTDIELWASGQLTMREQLARAAADLARSRPLMHSSDEAPVTHLERAWEQTALIEGDLVGDVARATHISVWVGTPFWEPETVDIGIGFPLTSQRLCDAVRSSCSFTPDYAESVIPTTPQLNDLFGSCIAIPAWAPAAGRYAFVLDCQGIGGTVYVVYMRLPLTRAALLRHVPEEDQTDVVFYCFGELTELQGQRTAPIQGGVIKVLYESADCLWAGPLEPRLLNPATWNPRVCHPSLIDGNFVIYQSPEDQLVYEDFMPDEDNRVVVAEQVMGYAPGQCWINSPTRPVEHLAHAGRHIRTQFAVNPGPRTTQRDDPALVVLYDLRGLCMFPQWLQLPGELFDYQDYLDDLQLPVIPGWTVVIEGGEATSRRTVLRVKDGDTLVFYLKESSELMATEEEQTSPADSDDEDNDTDSADDVNQMPNSSDFSSATPPGPGDPPRGPPPPSPVNRSRSPRRRVDIDTTLEAEPSGIKQIELFSLLPSAGFDIQKERLALPHIGQEFHALFEPWPLQWMCLEIGELDLHSSTIRALRALPHWSSFLESAPPKAQFTAHLYTDGSYFSDLAISGLGVVILLQCLDQSCLLGAVTGAVLGGDAELWSQNDPAPAMQAEQAAIIAALLWLGQGLRIFPITSAVVHFDCQAVGWGTNGLWAAATPLTEKAHELELLLRRFLRAGLEFNYIEAHEGQAWNELADVLAKAGAKQTKGLPAVPHATWRAFFAADLRWAATVYHGWTKGTLPIQPSQEFVWQPDQWVCGGSLRPDELLPTTTTTGADADKDTTFAAKILSVNVQGLKGMHRYLEEQCEQRGTQILCIQEHKDVAGLVQSKRYLRLASSSNKHWGTALWFSRTDGAFTIDGKPVCLQETDLQILQDHPRLLSVGATHRGLKFLFFSGHCPHAEKVEERASFLASLQDLQQQMQEADFVAGGLDLNGHHGVTGSLLCGEPDQVGAQIVTLLQRLGLWLPATYPTLHCGPSETYTHPSGRRHRIDFIAIGGRGRIYQARSAVASDFDTGGKGEDHQAVELHVGGCLRPTGLHGRLRRPLYDRESMLAPRGRQLIQQALRNYQVPAWEMHVDQHYGTSPTSSRMLSPWSRGRGPVTFRQLCGNGVKPSLPFEKLLPTEGKAGCSFSGLPSVAGLKADLVTSLTSSRSIRSCIRLLRLPLAL